MWRWSQMLAAIGILALIAPRAMAAGPSVSVTIGGAMQSKLDDFVHPGVSTKLKKKEYRLVLQANPASTMAAGGPMMQSTVLSFPMALKPGTYKVRGRLEMGHQVDATKAPVVALFSCSSMNELKFPKCLGYNRHAEGTLTLSWIGRTFSGHFRFVVQSAAQNSAKVIVSGSFANIPLHKR